MFNKKLKKRIKEVEYRIETIENLIMHEESKLEGFAILKKHLRPKDEKFTFRGKEI